MTKNSFYMKICTCTQAYLTIKYCLSGQSWKCPLFQFFSDLFQTQASVTIFIFILISPCSEVWLFYYKQLCKAFSFKNDILLQCGHSSQLTRLSSKCRASEPEEVPDTTLFHTFAELLCCQGSLGRRHYKDVPAEDRVSNMGYCAQVILNTMLLSFH